MSRNREDRKKRLGDSARVSAPVRKGGSSSWLDNDRLAMPPEEARRLLVEVAELGRLMADSKDGVAHHPGAGSSHASGTALSRAHEAAEKLNLLPDDLEETHHKLAAHILLASELMKGYFRWKGAVEHILERLESAWRGARGRWCPPLQPQPGAAVLQRAETARRAASAERRATDVIERLSHLAGTGAEFAETARDAVATLAKAVGAAEGLRAQRDLTELFAQTMAELNRELEGKISKLEREVDDAYMPVKEALEQWNEPLPEHAVPRRYSDFHRAKKENPWIRFDPKAPKNRPRVHRGDWARFLKGMPPPQDEFEGLDKAAEAPGLFDEMLDEYIAGCRKRRREVQEKKYGRRA